MVLALARDVESSICSKLYMQAPGDFVSEEGRCIYHLSVQPGMRICANFTNIDQNFPSVSVYDTNESDLTVNIASLHGDLGSFNRCLESSRVYIYFTTDYSVTKQGFRATYEALVALGMHYFLSRL
ncbi:hypothetical protein MAR_036893 [Mya arenaria]|uniref:CUB domain-containing protein n=1 Tax=Mya arenaria TaxID=6604 RepID=A0ABY7FQS6_MYAAR|nr:hypothetical protein MAR_036893 [Mya arenaria]